MGFVMVMLESAVNLRSGFETSSFNEVDALLRLQVILIQHLRPKRKASRSVQYDLLLIDAEASAIGLVESFAEIA